MIVCSCNVISDREIRQAVETLTNREPDAKLSARNVLAEMGCKPDCCGCMSHFRRIVREAR